jgi:hypothetical protein
MIHAEPTHLQLKTEALNPSIKAASLTRTPSILVSAAIDLAVQKSWSISRAEPADFVTDPDPSIRTKLLCCAGLRAVDDWHQLSIEKLPMYKVH